MENVNTNQIKQFNNLKQSIFLYVRLFCRNNAKFLNYNNIITGFAVSAISLFYSLNKKKIILEFLIIYLLDMIIILVKICLHNSYIYACNFCYYNTVVY